MTHGDSVAGVDYHRHHRRRLRPLPPPPPPLPTPFHVLEITIISAQDLSPTCGRTRAYAKAWVDPDYKLRTKVDRIGRTNPNWNEKFVFRVDDDCLRSETAAVTIVIKRVSRGVAWRDPVIGTARLVISTLNPSPEIQLVALQVRRPKSLRPQGMLNLGVAAYSDIGAAGEMAFRRTMSSRRGGEARESMGEAEKSGELGRWVVDREKEALQLKLEKWRTEISSEGADQRKRMVVAEKGRRRAAEGRFFGCFSGNGERWD